MKSVILMEVYVVNALGRSEPHVVLIWVVILPKCSHRGKEQWIGVLTQSLKHWKLAMV